MVRNWFLPKSDEIDPTCFSLDDTVADLLKNKEVQGMLQGYIGPLASNPIVPLLTKKLKIGTVINSKLIGVDDSMRELIADYLQTVKK